MSLDFRRAHVLVVGDVMLDRWFIGRVRRISPEAPVPIVQVQREHESLGGAANVAANIAGLGARCTLAGLVGRDSASDRLHRLLSAQGITAQLTETERPTTTKVRVIGDHQQVVRLDFEDTGDHPAEVIQRLVSRVEPLMANVDILVLSDYAKGVCDRLLCSTLIARALERSVRVLVDPKTTDWSRYRGATLVTPNFKEFSEAVGSNLANADEAIEAHTGALIERFGIGGLLITRSAQGMTLSTEGRHLHIRTDAKDVFDVTGAGDTVIGTLATALAAGVGLEPAVRLANRAAGVVVGRAGSVSITTETLEEALRAAGPESKVMSRESLMARLERDRLRGRRIVFTNGCFDVLHRGHLTYLQKARELGDRLVVGLNSDASVRRLKGPARPIQTEADRALMLASLSFVDYVCMFGADTPAELIASVRPDVLVKGGDYTLEQIVGREHAGEVVLIDFVDGYSTTKLLQRMGRAESEGPS